jgi:nucleoid-associated protein YgaU
VTRETKLGLLVGGAFILCFSLILSHSEDDQTVKSEIDTLALTGQAPASYGQRSERASIANWLAPPQAPAEDRLAPQVWPTAPFFDGPGKNVSPFNPPSGQKADAPAGWTAESETRQSPSPDTPSSPSQVADATIINRPLTAPEPGGVLKKSLRIAPASNVTAPLITALNSPRSATLASAAEPAAQPQPKPLAAAPTGRPKNAQLYVVGQGDSLSKIARKFYGSSETRSIDRIYEANRRLLPSANALRVGQELVIPDVSSPKPAAAAAPKNVRWYRVQPKDKYTTIAQSQLGASKRWKEIHDLNQDIFPDPNQIRPGVRIRLPAD